MTLRDKISTAIKTAMKQQDKQTLETLRFVWSEIKNKEIDIKQDLSDEQITALLRSEVKKRREAIEQFKTGNREDLAREEEEKLPVIELYLPQLMSEDDVRKVVSEIAGENDKDFGALMGKAMGQLKGKADGTLVSKVVREFTNS